MLKVWRSMALWLGAANVTSGEVSGKVGGLWGLRPCQEESLPCADSCPTTESAKMHLSKTFGKKWLCFEPVLSDLGRRASPASTSCPRLGAVTWP